jgi:hypothetical protein
MAISIAILERRDLVVMEIADNLFNREQLV